MKMTRLTWIGLLVLVFAGCSSSTTKHQDPASHSNSPTHSSDEDGAATSEEVVEPVAKEPIPVRDEKASQKLDRNYQALGRAIRAGQTQQTVEEASRILGTNPHDLVALNALAMHHYRKNQFGSAKLLIAKALEKHPDNATLYNNLAMINWAEGDSAVALLNLKKAVQLNGNSAEATGNLGSFYVQMGDFGKAFPLLEKSYRQNKNIPSIANNFGIALRVSRNFDMAKKVYQDAIKQNSRDTALQLNYAILLIDHMNQPKDGLEVVNKLKFLETERKDWVAKINALEKKAREGLK